MQEQESKKVFISYKRERRSDAAKLSRVLACYGIEAWYDEKLTTGEDFRNEINANLHGTRAIVVLWCKLSIESAAVKEEATHAVQTNAYLPTLIDEGVLPRDPFDKRQATSLVTWNGRPGSDHPGFQSLLSQIAVKLNLAQLELNAERVQRLEERLAATRNPGHCEEFADGSGLPMLVAVPEGHFPLGSPREEFGREFPAGMAGLETERTVTFDKPFAIGRYPVTRDQFAAFVNATSRDMTGGAFVCSNDNLMLESRASWLDPWFDQSDAHPVVCVSWHDAEAYVGWLSEATGEKYSLPSEDQWEYAVRARERSAFHWGDEIAARHANYDSRTAYAEGERTWDYRRGTSAVGAFGHNKWGISDAHGNVAEWCADFWQADRSKAGNNDGSAFRLAGADDGFRAIRGGSWCDEPRHLRCAARRQVRAGERHNHVGFRVVRKLVG